MSDGEPLRVMLVDDHELYRRGVRHALNAPDIDVVAEASSGEEAISLAVAHQPDLILLDLNMPGLGGIDVVREVGPRLPNTQIVILTGSAARLEVAEAIAAGAIGFLTKDLSPQALLRAVRGVRSGHLPMSRTLAAETMRHFCELVRQFRATGEMEYAGLTQRQMQVLRYLAAGQTDRQIASALGISPRTVEKHVAAVLRKLGVSTRFAAGHLYQPPMPPGATPSPNR